MLAGLLATLALAAPALAQSAQFHIKVQGDVYDLCIDNTDAKIEAGNPLQVYVPPSPPAPCVPH